MKQWQFVAAVTLFMTVSSGVLADAPGNTPNPTPASGQVASASPVVQVAGTETRLLPANYDVWSCEWAPDGNSMVFAGKIQGELSTKMRIWMWPLNPASNPTPFTNTENLTDFSPHWSPDGKNLVMLRVTYGKSSKESGLWIKNVANGEGKQLTIGNQDRDPFWSPDGTRVVFSRSSGPYQAQLFMVNTTDGALEVLRSQENEILTSPYWGINGKIYYTKMVPIQKDVTVAGQTYRVTDFGKGSIWAIAPGSSVPEPVVSDDYDNRSPALSPDGTKLAFVSDRFPGKDGNGKFDRGSLYVKNLLTGEIKLVANKVGLNGGDLSWSPDGQKIAFFTFRSIRPAIWVINVAPLLNSFQKASN